MRKLALSICALSLAAVPAVWAAGGPGDAPAPPEKDKSAATAPAQPAESAQPAAAAATPALAAELAELRALLKSQAAEIEAERRELAEMKAKLGGVKEEAVDAAVSAAVPAAKAAAAEAAPINVLTVGGSKSDGPEPGPGAWVDGRPPQDDKQSTLALHFKGITLTPGGFAAAETVWRNRAVDSDVNTAFTSVPYAASNESKISEFNLSGRQSRISMLMDGKLANVKIGGYYEGDFLSAGVTSNSRQSNSYTFRQRQFWAQARFDSGWTITGGQMWSLVTETRKGMDNRTEALPLTIDAQYEAGFNWSRQYGFRIVKDFDNKIWLGFSVEDAQEVVPTFHGNAANFVLQNTGNAGGLDNNTTNYTLNYSPDFVLKGVWEPGGNWGHWELFGLLRTFRARVYPCIVPANVTAPAECTGVPTTSFANNDVREGGGVGGGFRIPTFNKKLDIGLKGLYGDGVSRYGSSTLPDLAVRPVGTIAPLHGGSFLSTLEWHVTPKLDVYLNYGGDFVSRAYYTTLAGTATVPPVTIGYGSPFFVNSGCESPTEVAPGAGTPNKAGNCTGDLRNIQEGTIGFWHRIYKGDRGTMQWGAQYSYLKLTAWSGLGTPGVAGVFPQFNPHANDSMIFTSLRYYLP
jgi:hypothetical protein